MAFLPNLQETIQSHTGGVLYFRIEQTQDKSSQVSLGPDLSIVRQDYFELDYPWGRNSALEYIFGNATWKAGRTAPIILYGEEGAGKSSLVHALTSPSFLGKQPIGREVSTLVTLQLQSKVWESDYKLVFDLLDLTLARHVWSENSLLSVSYPSTVAQSLEQMYDFRKSIEISRFLEANPFLMPLLEEAYAHIRKYFPSSQLILEVVADPEALDEEQLVIFIVVKHDPDEASEVLNQLDEDWWLDAMERTQDKLCITLEFQ
jgi:GTPase SAR1 family protein